MNIRSRGSAADALLRGQVRFPFGIISTPERRSIHMALLALARPNRGHLRFETPKTAPTVLWRAHALLASAHGLVRVKYPSLQTSPRT
jgi:hypothetical protein